MLIAVVVLFDDTIVVEEAMAVLRADSLLNSVLNMAGTSLAHASGADKTFVAMRVVYWTTCCP